MNTRPDPRDPKRRNKMFKERPIQSGTSASAHFKSPRDMTKFFFDQRKAERKRLRPR